MSDTVNTSVFTSEFKAPPQFNQILTFMNESPSLVAWVNKLPPNFIGVFF